MFKRAFRQAIIGSVAVAGFAVANYAVLKTGSPSFLFPWALKFTTLLQQPFTGLN
jgi:hypothetical protein